MEAIKTFVQKLNEKSPLKYQLTRALRILNPSYIAIVKDAEKYMQILLDILVQSNRISGSEADNIIR